MDGIRLFTTYIYSPTTLPWSSIIIVVTYPTQRLAQLGWWNLTSSAKAVWPMSSRDLYEIRNSTISMRQPRWQSVPTLPSKVGFWCVINLRDEGGATMKKTPSESWCSWGLGITHEWLNNEALIGRRSLYCWKFLSWVKIEWRFCKKANLIQLIVTYIWVCIVVVLSNYNIC